MATATLSEMTAEMERLEAEERRIEEVRNRRLQLQQELEARQTKAKELHEQFDKLVGEKRAVEERLRTETSRINDALSELQKQLEQMEGVVRRRGRPKGSKNKRRGTVVSTTSTGKRRGRPKGSKNKPKAAAEVSVNDGEGSEDKSEPRMRGRSANDRPAINFVIDVLQAARQPLNLEDLYAGAKAMGFKTSRDGGTDSGAMNALYTSVWEEKRRAKAKDETPRVVTENTPAGLLFSLA